MTIVRIITLTEYPGEYPDVLKIKHPTVPNMSMTVSRTKIKTPVVSSGQKRGIIMRLLIMFLMLAMAQNVSARQLSLHEVSFSDWMSFSEMEKEIFVAESCKHIVEIEKEKFILIPNVKMIVRVLDSGIKDADTDKPDISVFRLLYRCLKDTGYFAPR
ncbi:MAG: hypothetical protein WC300_06400 [Candidatus Omnitrophota bacterium]|jgi:hypothetical protein